MRFGSVCSGIEAASCAWEPLGWRASFLSEIADFPRAVLSHHYPAAPLRGDFTEIRADDHDAIDLLVGGTPCQSFSLAGLRGGMADARGNLALEYLRLADRLRPRWLVWENVPGVLSSNGGRDFGSFLGGLGQLGYGWAYRVLDAQYWGLAQRRRRVFVVGYLGDWRRAAAVLFERQSLRGDPPPRRQARERTSPTLSARASAGGGLGTDHDINGGLILPALDAPGGGGGLPELATTLRARDGAKGVDSDCTDTLLAFGGNNCSGPIDVATALNASRTASGRQDFETETFITHTLRGTGFDASEDGTVRGTPPVPVGFTIHGTDPTVQRVASEDDLAQCLRARAPGNIDNSSTSVVLQPLPFDTTQITSRANRSNPRPGDPCHPLTASGDPPAVARGAVRRLTPRECERLQGFPDDYTLIPHGAARRIEADYFDWLRVNRPDLSMAEAERLAKDSPRYQALGNSMAVPVMAWIGRRIAMVDRGG